MMTTVTNALENLHLCVFFLLVALEAVQKRLVIHPLIKESRILAVHKLSHRLHLLLRVFGGWDVGAVIPFSFFLYPSSQILFFIFRFVLRS
jgi:hypothetical protein